MWTRASILEVLDAASRDFTFPMLDNGYVYLAATRLSAYRSDDDWALVFEVFGFSPRSGFPDLGISTFGSTIANRKSRADYVSDEAYENYLRTHAHDDMRFFQPIDQGTWLDPDNEEVVDPAAAEISLRGCAIAMPNREEFAHEKINLEESDQLMVFELCRFLAARHRSLVLATEHERRVNVPPSLERIITLDDWNHPDLAGDEVASDSSTFQQLATILSSHAPPVYEATGEKNTHWSNWPEGGTL